MGKVEYDLFAPKLDLCSIYLNIFMGKIQKKKEKKPH